MTKNTLRRKNNIERYKYGWIFPTQKRGSYMHARKVKRVFKKWLKENMHRFNYKPYPKNSVCKEYYFEGIAKNISLVMNYNSPEAMIFHCNPLRPNECCNHDALAYVGYEKYDNQKGYYNAYSENGEYEYFATQEELYSHVVFNWIIVYVNERFMEENALYIDESDSFIGSRTATKSNQKKIKNKFCFDLFTGELLAEGK